MIFTSPTRDWTLAKQHRERLAIGLTLSLLIHVLISTLQFGTPGFGLPRFDLPWSERRAETPSLSVLLTQVKSAPEAPAGPGKIEPEPKQVVVPARAQTLAQARTATLSVVPSAAQVKLPDADLKPAPAAKEPNREPAAPLSLGRQVPTQAKSPPKIIAQTESRPDSFVVPPPTAEALEPQITPKAETPKQVAEINEHPAPETTAAKAGEGPATQTQEQAAQKLAAEENARRIQETEARKLEEANAKRQALELEAQKQARQAEEIARQQAAALALQKQEQAAQKLEEEKTAQRTKELEAIKLEEAKKQERARVERQALELEAQKQARQAEEIARRQAAALARQQQAEELAAKERAQELAMRQKAASVAAQQRERISVDEFLAATPRAGESNKPADTTNLPRNLSGNDLAAKALAQARTLDATRSEPQLAKPSAGAAENSRRSIFGSVDRDIGLTMYIESWRLKIERNGNLNYSQSSRDKARGDPLVTVAIRSDGTVEDIVIHRSSGRPELDEAVRRIVRLNARYSVFPPNLARKYDVIEIRRAWNFDDKLRILEELP